MSERFRPLPRRSKGEQALAADPSAHAALSASAGTGKTAGPDGAGAAPAAAGRAAGIDPVPDLHQGGGGGDGQPHRRPGSRPGCGCKDSELFSELLALGEDIGPAGARERARRLFAKVLDAPGASGSRPSTASPRRLLAAFPAEAGIAPGFQPIEGRAEQELVRRTLAELMADAEATGDERLIARRPVISAGGSARTAPSTISRPARARPDAMTHLGERRHDRADAPRG